MRSSFSVLCLSLAACGLFSSCAHRRAGPVVRAEMCANSACRMLGLPGETRVYENCLLVEKRFEDGTPYQVVECLPGEREAPEFMGGFVTGTVYDRPGLIEPNTPLHCRVVPEYGMDCWPAEDKAEEFTVFLVNFRADLAERGLVLEPGAAYETCLVFDQGQVGCWVIDPESPRLDGIYFVARPAGFHRPSRLPFGTTVACQYIGGDRLTCRPP